VRFFIDGWMVGIFVGVRMVTHYAIASRLGQSYMALIVAVLGILSPWFSQLWGSADFAGIRRIFALATKASASLSTIIASALVLYGHAFVQTWMGQAYMDAYWPLVILVTAIFIDVSQQPSVSYLYGVSRHRFLAWLTLAEALSNVGLSIYWARQYGMIGVALGTLIPMTITKVFIQPVYVCRHLPLSLRTYYVSLLGRSILPPALCSFLLWATLLRRFHFSNVASVCVAIFFQALVCAVVAFLFSFDRGEKSILAYKILPVLHIRWRPRAVRGFEVG
jgi:O-antigen/teichoic acid export membrane protein